MLIAALVGKVLVAVLVEATMAEEEVEMAAKEKAEDDMAEILSFKKIGKNVFL